MPPLGCIVEDRLAELCEPATVEPAAIFAFGVGQNEFGPVQQKHARLLRTEKSGFLILTIVVHALAALEPPRWEHASSLSTAPGREGRTQELGP